MEKENNIRIIQNILIKNAPFNFSSLENADRESVCYCNIGMEDKLSKKCLVLIASNYHNIKNIEDKAAIVVLVKNPKEFYIDLLNIFYGEGAVAPIEKRKFVHLGKNVIIGENTEIHPFSYIYDGTIIGNNVTIGPFCCIGGAGFNYVKTEEGENKLFPHISNVIIGDNVTIHSKVNIDRGVLTPTIIGKGVKIDSNCHIGHNCNIGENTILTAGTILGGGTIIGKDCWFSLGSITKDNVKIGNNVFVGLYTVVTKDVKDNEKIINFPQESIKDFKRRLLNERD